jgi:hypothetical protein
MLVYHKGLRVRKKPLSFVACAWKAAILRVQIWSVHESDVVGLILRAAALDGPSNLQVANELQCNRHTVSRWRHRSLAHGLNGLQDAPRSGRPRRFSPLSASGCDGDGNS